jgi:hypothetical protein
MEKPRGRRRAVLELFVGLLLASLAILAYRALFAPPSETGTPGTRTDNFPHGAATPASRENRGSGDLPSINITESAKTRPGPGRSLRWDETPTAIGEATPKAIAPQETIPMAMPTSDFPTTPRRSQNTAEKLPPITSKLPMPTTREMELEYAKQYGGSTRGQDDAPYVKLRAQWRAKEEEHAKQMRPPSPQEEAKQREMIEAGRAKEATKARGSGH